MPRRRNDVCRLCVFVPKQWRSAVQSHAESIGSNESAVMRSLLDEAMTSHGIKHTPDVVGVHEKRWRITRSERAQKQAAKRQAYMKKYRERLKQRKLDAANEADASIIWTFHSSGQITTSDLDPLGVSVGVVSESGVLELESKRYGKDRVLRELRKLIAVSALPSERFEKFLMANAGQNEM